MEKQIWRIGSRESKLAVAQTNLVIEEMKRKRPDIQIELVTFKTTGDKILHKTLDKVGGKGLFVKELDQALMEGQIDLAVHSLKDVPMEENEELPIVAYVKRGDPRDVLVLPDASEKRMIHENEKDAVWLSGVGTSSMRRKLQLEKLWDTAQVKSVRGNIHTRLKKLDDGEYHALILAAAGLIREGLEKRISYYFEPQEMLPAAGQGILAVQCRKDFPKEEISWLNDRDTEMAAEAERGFVRALNGGCSSPVAAYATVRENTICLKGLYYRERDGFWTIGEKKGDILPDQAAISARKLGEELADTMKKENACL